MLDLAPDLTCRPWIARQGVATVQVHFGNATDAINLCAGRSDQVIVLGLHVVRAPHCRFLIRRTIRSLAQYSASHDKAACSMLSGLQDRMAPSQLTDAAVYDEQQNPANQPSCRYNPQRSSTILSQLWHKSGPDSPAWLSPAVHPYIDFVKTL